jgi:putative spermidine/putrescine transport system permease protein
VLRISKLIFASLVLLPMAAGLVYALLYSFGLIGITSQRFTVEYWSAVLAQDSFWKSIAFSALQAGVGVLLTVVISLLVLQTLKEKKEPKTFLFYPLIIAPVVVAFAFFSFWSDSGFVAKLCYQMGLISAPNEFPSIINSNGGLGILLAHLFLGVPFFVISFLNIYKSFNLSDLKVLSKSLGSSKIQALFKVEIPILLRQSSRQILLYFVFFFGAYEIPLLLGSESNRMFSILILDKLTKFDISEKPQAFVMTSFYLISMLTILFFMLKKTPKRDA